MATGITISSGEPHLTFDGLPGNVYVIEASTNFSDWTPISTNNAPVVPWEFQDSGATNFPLRFYRIRAQ